MKEDSKTTELKTALRKLERQAKQLLYKMDRLESDWNKVKDELNEQGLEIRHRLGDILHGWQKKI